MAHLLEQEIDDPQPIVPFTGSYKIYRVCGGTRTWSSTVFKQYPDDSPVKYKYRTASVHTAKDVHGWRQPTAYHALFIETDPLPNSVYAENGCSRVWRGLISTAGLNDLYRYPYSQAKTPHSRQYSLVRENMRNWTKTKALAKLNKSEFMLGVTYGERIRTYKMVVDAIQDVTWFFRMLKRRKYSKIWRAWKRSGKDPWSFYLQYRYGWSQIYRDIFNLLEVIEDLEDGTYERLRIYVKSGIKVPYNSFAKVSSQNGGLWFNSRVSGEETSFTRMDFTPKDVGYITLNALGVNPITVGWELIPYSFVADWFLNIGTFLEAYMALPGYSYVGGSTTLTGKYVEKGEFETQDWSKVNCSPMENHMFEFKRIVEGTPAPALAINPDVLIGKMSAVRIADAVALMAQSRNQIWR